MSWASVTLLLPTRTSPRDEAAALDDEGFLAGVEVGLGDRASSGRSWRRRPHDSAAPVCSADDVRPWPARRTRRAAAGCFGTPPGRSGSPPPARTAAGRRGSPASPRTASAAFGLRIVESYSTPACFDLLTAGPCPSVSRGGVLRRPADEVVPHPALLQPDVGLHLFPVEHRPRHLHRTQAVERVHLVGRDDEPDRTSRPVRNSAVPVSRMSTFAGSHFAFSSARTCTSPSTPVTTIFKSAGFSGVALRRSSRRRRRCRPAASSKTDGRKDRTLDAHPTPRRRRLVPPCIARDGLRPAIRRRASPPDFRAGHPLRRPMIADELGAAERLVRARLLRIQVLVLQCRAPRTAGSCRTSAPSARP